MFNVIGSMVTGSGCLCNIDQIRRGAACGSVSRGRSKETLGGWHAGFDHSPLGIGKAA
jgi:hypothetical protein